MTESIALELLKEWGPWGIVAFLLLRCTTRQDKREERLIEVIKNNATVMQNLINAVSK